MKRIYAFIVAAVMVISFGVGAQAAVDVNSLFTQLKDQLLKSGLTTADISAVQSPVKSMLGLGAGQADIKNILLNLVSQGFAGKDLGSLTSLVNNLMQNGQVLKNAWAFVSQAMQQAKAGGLSGSDLVAKVQQAIGSKITQLNQLKSTAQSAIPSAATTSNAATSADSIKKGIGSIFGK